MNIPTIKTSRLQLRPQLQSDWELYAMMMTSKRSKYMGGPYSQSGAWGMFCSDLAQWLLFGHGALMICLQETGECVGQVGINHGPLFPEKELGWFVYSQAEGKGYAFEAALAFRRWAIESLEISSLVSYVHPDNVRSCKLAEKLGAVLDAEAARPDPSDLVYRHPICLS